MIATPNDRESGPTPVSTKVVRRVQVTGGGEATHPHAPANGPGHGRSPDRSGAQQDPVRLCAAVTAERVPLPAPRRLPTPRQPIPGNATPATEIRRDVWLVLAGSRTENALRTLAAAQDEVFRRYLPMARTLANRRDPGGPPVDCANAEKAAELGLAHPVLGWRRPDSDGFDLFASVAIAAQLDRLPVADTGDREGQPGGRPIGRTVTEPR